LLRTSRKLGVLLSAYWIFGNVARHRHASSSGRPQGKQTASSPHGRHAACARRRQQHQQPAHLLRPAGGRKRRATSSHLSLRVAVIVPHGPAPGGKSPPGPPSPTEHTAGASTGAEAETGRGDLDMVLVQPTLVPALRRHTGRPGHKSPRRESGAVPTKNRTERSSGGGQHLALTDL
jgi:hypothetical protein